jgi:hypothetical protein
MMVSLKTTEMPTRLPKVSAYINDDLKLELEKIAHRQGRSLSNLVAFVLREYAEDQKQKERQT